MSNDPSHGPSSQIHDRSESRTAGGETAAGATPGTEPSMRPFFTLWTGQTLSLLGSNAVQFALIWWVTQTTGSATILATATLVGLLPQVALGPVIGALVDRWSRKTVMLLADGVVAAASLVLAAMFASGAVGTADVLVLLFVRAVGGAFHAPAMTASTTLMVPERHFTRIQGLNQSLQGVLLIAGAPFGALLYGWMPMAGVMLVDVVTAFFAIVPLLFTRVPRPSVTEDTRSSVWGDMVAGFRYLRERSGHGTLIGLAAMINLLLVPAFALLPLLVMERVDGNATLLAWTMSAFGVGMLVGGVLLGVWGGFSRGIVTTLLGMIALGIAVFAVGATPQGASLWLMTAMFAVGLTVPLVNGPIHAILQGTISPEFQGRVFTLLGSFAGAMAPIGLLLAAPVAELVGVGSWYVAGGVTCVVMGTVGFLSPALMRIETQEALG